MQQEIITSIAGELKIGTGQVDRTLALLAEGNTIERKRRTDSMRSRFSILKSNTAMSRTLRSARRPFLL